jgi:RHS repeat-associated protein
MNNINNIKEQKDYYPFGKEHENANLMSSTNRWGYNGKEKQTVGNLNYLDYINRMYDPEIGRWFVQDPLQEKYYSWSSYNYCMGNPIAYIDADGRQPFFFGISPVSSPLLGISDPIILGNKPITSPIIQQAARIINQTGKEVIKPGPTVEAAKSLPKMENHHLIPRALKGEEMVKDAIKEGFKFDGKENKVPVEKFSKQTGEGQHGNHPKYTEHIRDKLTDFQEKNPSPTGQQALEGIRGIVSEVKNIIETNVKVKINDLFQSIVQPLPVIPQQIPITTTTP